MKTTILILALSVGTFAQSTKIANLYQSEYAKLTYMAKAKSNGDVTNSFRITMLNQFYFQSKVTKDYLFGKEDQKLKFEIGLFF